MKKIFITGVSGFIGAHLAQVLRSEGHKVAGLDRLPPKFKIPGVKYLLGDVRGADWRKIAAWKPEVIIHLAGPALVSESFKDMHREVSNSIDVTAFLVEKLRKMPKARLLYFSSAAVYGDHPQKKYGEKLACDPVSPYGLCKLATEWMIRMSSRLIGFDYAIARPFSIYGGNLKKQVVYDLTKRFLKEKKTVLIQSTGKEKRDFVHINDCCMAISSLLKKKNWGGVVFNLGTGRGVSLGELVRIIYHLTGSRSGYEFLKKDRIGNPLSLVADPALLNSMGFSCKVDLREGLADTVKIIRAEL